MSEPVYTMFKEDDQFSDQDKLKLEKLIARAITYWPFFAVCIFLSLSLGYLFLRYSTPIYKVHAKVLIKEDKKGSFSDGQVFQELGINSGVSNVDNEVEIFKSRILMQQVVKDLHLNIRYWTPGKIMKTEVYNDIPFSVVPLFPDSTIQGNFSYQITLNDNNSEYKFVKGNKSWTGKFNDTLKLDVGAIILLHNSNAKAQYNNVKHYEVDFAPAENMAGYYLSGLEVAAINKQVSILNLSVQDNLPKRGENVLNKLIEVYMQANIDDRNKVSDGTISFIDERLGIIGTELGGIERQIQGFKQDNQFTDLKDQSKILLDNTSDYTKELTQQEVQLKVVESLEKYIQGHSNRVVPSTLLVQDMMLTKIIDKYNTLQSQRESLLMSNTLSSPYIKNIDEQIESLRGDMYNNLSSIKSGLQITINSLKNREGYFNDKIKQVPQKERVFLEYSRQQNIKQELYVFLLKKREETAISKSSTIANARMIEPAKKEGHPFRPSKSEVLFSALAIGIIVPGIRVLFKELFNLKITSKEDIARATSMAVIGEIGHNPEEDVFVIHSHAQTILAEQFRALRTNLQFLFTGKNDKIVMITSSMSGEGKSFITINLAMTLALSNKKVLLIELDLRKPRISKNLGITNKIGFTDYAIGKASLDDIIISSKESPNLYIIPSGIIPPNPSELIMLNSIELLFTELKERFDYVIIDTPPVGLVTDAQLLYKYADAALYVVRQDYTYKEQVRMAHHLYTSGKMPKMSIVVNDVKLGKGSKYGYGYGGYGNGYYSDITDRKSIVNRIKKITKK